MDSDDDAPQTSPARFPGGLVYPDPAPLKGLFNPEPRTPYVGAPAYNPFAGRVGLVNLGNTCFLNATLQALSHVRPLARHLCETPLLYLRDLERAPAARGLHKGTLGSELIQVVAMLWGAGGEPSYSPRSLLAQVCAANPSFEGGQQQDAHEALVLLLQGAHEHLAQRFPLSLFSNDHGSEANRARRMGGGGGSGGGAAAVGGEFFVPPGREWLQRGPFSGPEGISRSALHDLFQGVLASRVRCRECGTESLTYESFLELNLPVPKHPHPATQGANGAPGSYPAGVAEELAAPPGARAQPSPRDKSSPRGGGGGGGSSKGWFSWLLGGGGGGEAVLGLGDCLASFFDWEPLVGDSLYQCTVCRRHCAADKRLELVALPEVLCVTLKRFSSSQGGIFFGPGSSKTTTPVAFPVKGAAAVPAKAGAAAATAGAGLLDLSPFVSSGDHEGAAVRAYTRSKALQTGAEDASGASSSGGASPRQVMEMNAEVQGILLHRASLARGVTGVEACSAQFALSAMSKGQAGAGGDAGGERCTITEDPQLGFSQSFRAAYGAQLGGGGSGAAAAAKRLVGAPAAACAARHGPAPVPAARVASPLLMGAHARYSLVSMVQHQGSMEAGHYVAHALDPDERAAAGRWLTFDDRAVFPVDAGAVAASEAYILFFQREPAAGPPLAAAPLPSAHAPLPSAEPPAEDADPPPPPPYFVSRAWWSRYRSVGVPGPVTSADILCDHGALLPEVQPHASAAVVALSSAQHEALVAAYGASSPPLRSLDACEACGLEAELLNLRREREKTLVTERDHQHPAGNERWYIISERWLAAWRSFVKGDAPLPPGPIDNTRLLHNKTREPLKYLKPQTHFRALNKDSWVVLHGAYGGGPTLTIAGMLPVQINIHHPSFRVE